MALGMALMLVYFIMMPWIVRIGSNLVPIEWEKSGLIKLKKLHPISRNRQSCNHSDEPILQSFRASK